eukprot:c27377_g1_i1.p1 GENE.c27377_g1_i1~~c27377_g1_i1.p1  ORF type:complete len:151 (-),score=71.21 c27377_g1_i1:41-460(-)
MTELVEEKELTKDEVSRKYQVLKTESNQLMKQVRDLQAQRSEHKLVVDALTLLPAERRAFRMVGGILVERTVAEILPAVTSNLEKIEETAGKVMERLKAKEAEVVNFQTKYRIRMSAEDLPTAQQAQKEEGSKSTGVLA